MKNLLLLTLTLITISCGKNHSLTQAQSLSLASQKIFFKEEHSKETLAFREKAIFRFNNDLLKVEQNHVSLFEDTNLFMSFVEEDKAKARVVVLYSQYYEIYYVERGLKVDELAKSLNLIAEDNRKFYPLENDFSLTAEGKTFFLLSLNSKDLMKTDRDFFSITKNINKNEELEILKGQSVILAFSGNLFKNTTSWVNTQGGRAYRCTRDLLESGMCGVCEYKKEVVNQNFEFLSIMDIRYLNFIHQKNSDYKLVIKESFQKEDKAIFIMEAAKEKSIFSVDEISYASAKKMTLDRDRSSNCLGENQYRELYLNVKGEEKIQIDILGRGELLEKAFKRKHP